ncbi:hypothetical protein [Vibrio hepatarius]|uniref:hypothetical protein n=1 Tax=Vibrio hepatarius TaxID=171383 RepID=UPI001C085838|nr:hypothetical protein [Vibrio hepatarius]MBU2898046.1 hypothetical protein [Vibrio hepatarius]
MFSKYLKQLKALSVLTGLTLVAYLSYDYGVTSTQLNNERSQDVIFDKLERKQEEAYTLAVALASQQQRIEIRYRTIEKEVFKYAQKNHDKQCIITDPNWMRIRAESVRTHNRAIGIQQPSPVSDGATKTATSYERDAEVLAEDVANLQTCAENAQQLLSLQRWISSQINQ